MLLSALKHTSPTVRFHTSYTFDQMLASKRQGAFQASYVLLHLAGWFVSVRALHPSPSPPYPSTWFHHHTARPFSSSPSTSSSSSLQKHGQPQWPSGVDSSRAGFYKSLDGVGTPPVDPIIRSQVREKLREKRREPFSKEMGQEILEQLKYSSVIPVRVLVDIDLRQTLRLTRREKKARLFMPPEAKSNLQTFLDQIYQAFPVQGMPHNLVVKIRSRGENEANSMSAEEDTYITIKDESDLVQAFEEADKAGQLLQLYIRADKTAAAAMVPEYMIAMDDPRQSPTMQMVSFYRFFPEPKDEEALALLAKRLRAVWEPFGALGRIYVASEGINAQMAVPANVFSNFAAACNSMSDLEGVFLNTDRQVSMQVYREDPAFDALHIRIRNQVVADGGLSEVKAYDWSDCGKPMEPEEWHATVDDPNVIVLDCRNEFESEVGRFVSATALNTSFFRESWDVLKTRLRDVPKDQPILTYCTGGIRCIKVGAYLKQELGFENVARLEGGIVFYARHLREQQGEAAAAATDSPTTKSAGVIPDSKFKGINYVFDNRLGERITEDILSECDQCSVPSDVYVNCANPSCHVRFIQCASCGSKYNGCCSRGCMQAVADLAMQPPPGGYPPPPKTIYPPGVEEAFPLGPIPLGRTSPKQNKRVWLQPGPFQNAALNRALDIAIDEYTEAEMGEDEGSSKESDLLQRLNKETEAIFPGGAHMLSGFSQGRLLASITKQIGARNVLEIGTFTGYATLCFAEGIVSTGRVVTLEIDDRAGKIARNFFQESGYDDLIDLKMGPAMEYLNKLAALPTEERPMFDIIFLDGDKKRYKEYYEMILGSKLLSPAGLLIADNVLWKGLVPELARCKAKGEELPVQEYGAMGFTKRQVQLAGVLHDFNMHVRADCRTEQAFLPIRDGLLVIRWKGFERTALPGEEKR